MPLFSAKQIVHITESAWKQAIQISLIILCIEIYIASVLYFFIRKKY